MLYIYGPEYSATSNGIKCLFELLNILNNNGIKTKYICNGPHTLSTISSDNILYYENNHIQINSNDIVIYPETISDNPLDAKNIIRWLMNCPYVLTGKGIEYNPTDYVMAYSTLINKNLPQLFLIIDERELFLRIKKTSKRNKGNVAIYFGKIRESLLIQKLSELESILNCFETVSIITRNFPTTHEETLSMLANSSLLVSFDPLTNINYESVLLGTPVLIMDDAYDTAHTIFNLKQNGYFYDFAAYESATININDTFEDYCNYLDKQSTLVANTIQSAIIQLDRIHSDKSIAEENALINETLQDEDFNRFSLYNKITYKNIFTALQLPRKVRKMLSRHKLNPVHILSRKDQLYYKIPGDLTAFELLYLLLRRVKLLFSR